MDDGAEDSTDKSLSEAVSTKLNHGISSLAVCDCN